MGTTMKKSFNKHLMNDLGLVILMFVLIVLFTVGSSNFLTFLNIRNILLQNAHVAVVSMAVAIIMISGGTDLSIGYQIALAAVLGAISMEAGVPVIIAVLIFIAVCIVCSAFNMCMSIILKGHTMIITLGTMILFQGLAYTISQAKNFHKFPEVFINIGQSKIAGIIPINVMIMIVLFIITWIGLEKTHAGKKLYAAGDNPEAARLAGINVSKVKITAFAIAGILTGIGAIMLTARTGNATATTGTGLEFTGITACVLGGVTLKGGEGRLWKVIVATYVLGILSNGMQLIGLGTYPQFIAKGIVMLFSIGLGNNVFSQWFARLRKN